MRRILTIATLAVAALVLAAAASAATPSPSYQVGGFAFGGASDTVSAFTGVATGSAGDRGLWRGSLTHDSFAACTATCAVTGGSYTLTTNNGSLLDGTFTGGVVTAQSTSTAACGTQQFSVGASVFTDSGPFDFNGVVTNYRFGFRGVCRTLLSTIQGTLTQSNGNF